MRYTECDRGFFSQSAEKLAPQLLGKVLCRRFPNGSLHRFRIYDVEAYCAEDTANYGYGHEENKRRTKANAPLFQKGGTWCVYGGMLLVVCGQEGKPDNVLIRGCADQDSLYDGPLKVATALHIGRQNQLHGEEILSSQILWLETDDSIGSLCKRMRWGLSDSVDEDDKKRRWRFTTI